jgi:hypothetical protein
MNNNGKQSKWPCFLCGKECYETEGRGSSPWTCPEHVKELVGFLQSLIGNGVAWYEEGPTIGWDDLDFLRKNTVFIGDKDLSTHRRR